MVAVIALMVIFTRIKVAAAQRMVICLRSSERSLVGGRLAVSICSSRSFVAAGGVHLASQLPLKRARFKGSRFMGRCPRAGGGGLA